MASSAWTQAVVLSRIDVGEEDRIVTFLTRDHGLLKAAVGGGKSLKKGKAASIDLFALSRVQFHISSKPDKLARIRAVEILEPFLRIRSDYQSTCAASFMAELVSRCVQEDDPVPAVFDLFLRCLDRLVAGSGIYRTLTEFEIRLLRELGMAPELDRCLACGSPVREGAIMVVGEGGVMHPECAPEHGGLKIEAGDLATLRFLAERPFTTLNKLKVDEARAKLIFDAVHRFSRHHLGFEPRALSALKA